MESNFTANPSSNICPTDTRHRPFITGRTWAKHAANENRGMGSREMCDEHIVVTSGCPTHIPFRAGVLYETKNLSPQQRTVHPESTKPRELTCILS